MTIDDLEIGYLVEFREEGYGIISADDEKIVVYQDCSYDSINNWNKDLTDKTYYTFDIIKVYKPKNKPSLFLSLDDYELLWERKNNNALAIEACRKIEEQYRCGAKSEAILDDSHYKFTFDFGYISFTTTVCMDNISTAHELLHILYRLIDEGILYYFKY